MGDDRIGTEQDRRDLERAKLAEEFFVDELPPRAPRPMTEVEAFEAAALVLLLADPGDLTPLGRLWRLHAAEHLARRLDVYLRGDVPRTVSPEALDAALPFLKAAARDLREAAAALHEAAEKFRTLGHGWPANRTYHAATAAERAAERLDPE